MVMVMVMGHHARQKSIISQMQTKKNQKEADARECLLRIVSSLLFLAKQGLAVRGHFEGLGNFDQLLLRRSHDFPKLGEWLRWSKKWSSHDIQNDILQIASHMILQKLVEQVQKKNGISLASLRTKQYGLFYF
eukprot:Pompholyxophrys_punicea_v1_NODE_1058_length_1003_cov_4.238397.p1 type:complete len:133 gc:universal NODE_1058_length_1003_cov_4.238397:262-660(+)